MPRDPLSISATILPKTTYDPLTRSDEMLKEFLDAKKETYESQKKIFDELKVPEAWEDQKIEGILNERENLYNFGTNAIMEGYDLEDTLNPKNRKKYFEFQRLKSSYDSKVNKYLGQKTLLTESAVLLAKDAGKDLDIDKTKQNILALKNAKTVEEADNFLQSVGYNLIVRKEKPIDIAEYIGNNLDKFITAKTGKTETIDLEKGITTTVDYETISPEQVQKGLKSLYAGSDELKKSIELIRGKDPLDNHTFTDEENLNWLYKTFGNTKLKNKIEKSIQTLPGFSEEKKSEENVSTRKVNIYGLDLANAIDYSNLSTEKRTLNSYIVPEGSYKLERGKYETEYEKTIEKGKMKYSKEKGTKKEIQKKPANTTEPDKYEKLYYDPIQDIAVLKDKSGNMIVIENASKKDPTNFKIVKGSQTVKEGWLD